MASRSGPASGGKRGSPNRIGSRIYGVALPEESRASRATRNCVRGSASGAVEASEAASSAAYDSLEALRTSFVDDARNERFSGRDGALLHEDASERRGGHSLSLAPGLGAGVIGLVRTIEDEILPRLKVAITGVTGEGGPHPLPTYEQVGELARLSITREDQASLEYVEGMLQGGMPIEKIYEGLLVPAARRLGEFWSEDAYDFSEVTVGVLRLQKIQRALSRQLRQSGASFAATAVSLAAQRRALILPLPGEQHSFGSSIVQDFFARAGWMVDGYPLASESELASTVRAEAYDMVGLTLSRDDRLQELASCVGLVRRASRNKSVIIAVGGPPFVADPLRASAVGADATGATAAEAVAAVDAALTRVLRPL